MLGTEYAKAMQCNILLALSRQEVKFKKPEKPEYSLALKRNVDIKQYILFIHQL